MLGGQGCCSKGSGADWRKGMTAASWQQHGSPGVQGVEREAVRKANCILGCQSMHALSSRSGKVICPLHLVVRRSHLEQWCAHLHPRKVMPNSSKLSRGPWGGWGVEQFSCEEKLRDLGSFSLGKVQGWCTALHHCLIWGHGSHKQGLFWDVLLWDKKHNGYKLEYEKFWVDAR